MATTVPITGDTPITIKVSVNDSLKKLKLPLKDLGAVVFLDKLRHLLAITPEQTVVFERFSDSAGGYVVLDSANPAVFKTLIRAAKAKLKLRLKATITPDPALQVHTVFPNFVAPNVVLGQHGPGQHGPIIARTPVYHSSPRSSRPATALDFGLMGPSGPIKLMGSSMAPGGPILPMGPAGPRKHMGSGRAPSGPIPMGSAMGPSGWQFKEPLDQHDDKENTEEAPVPHPFSLLNDLNTGLHEAYKAQASLALRTRPSLGPAASPPLTWSVYCNMCDKAMNNVHFHCSICDGGDYDLCEGCVESGRLCPGDDHWLVKRYIKDGRVISSTTERLAPKSKSGSGVLQEPVTKDPKQMPGSFMDDANTLAGEENLPFRTCNSCVEYGKETDFVTCTVCDDFDLCLSCHASNKHGHHPGHALESATDATVLSLVQASLLPAGRNARHNAICDGCDKSIYGVRHKCFNCPDFDYCNDCIKGARISHPHHRFAALYEPLPPRRVSQAVVRHRGIYCDGAACTSMSKQSFIEGVRYKCAICHDTDFCASCEALPCSAHNKTHPLIKIKTPIKGLYVSTASEGPSGFVHDLGDNVPAPQPKQELSEEIKPMQSPNATAPVRIVADIKPNVGHEMSQSSASKAHSIATLVARAPHALDTGSLWAEFMHDAIPDGTVLGPNERFTQVWTMRNSGSQSWPAGCSVRYVGGDSMLNVNDQRMASVSDIAEATESNVIGREVLAGEEVAFMVTMKTPDREGKAISYWRLKAADGTPFGHRLWADVMVRNVVLPVAQDESDRIDNPLLSARFDQLRLDEARDRTRLTKRIDDSNITPPSQMHKSYAQYAQQMTALKNFEMLNSHSGPSSKQMTLSKAQEVQKQLAQARAAMDVKHGALSARLDQLMALRQAACSASYATDKPETPASETMTSSPASETKNVDEQAKAVTCEVESKDEEKLKGSQMIFPTLEKESPASSTYQSMTSSRNSKGKAAYVEDEESGEKTADASQVVVDSVVEEPAAATEATAAADSVSASDSEAVASTDEGFEDLTDDLEVFSADEEEGEDTGFLTDEEYDILDASDQETVASK